MRSKREKREREGSRGRIDKKRRRGKHVPVVFCKPRATKRAVQGGCKLGCAFAQKERKRRAPNFHWPGYRTKEKSFLSFFFFLFC
jgi:hypothetical protein